MKMDKLVASLTSAWSYLLKGKKFIFSPRWIPHVKRSAILIKIVVRSIAPIIILLIFLLLIRAQGKFNQAHITKSETTVNMSITQPAVPSISQTASISALKNPNTGKLITTNNNEINSLISNPLFILLAGIIGGWFFSRGMSYISKPNIRIELGGDAYLLRDTASEMKFLHVNINNKKRNLLTRFLIGNATANNARAWVSFIDPITRAEILKINGRWTTTREPVDYSTHAIDIGQILTPAREVIPAGENSEVSVALKHTDDELAYAFNNESYLPNTTGKNFGRAEFELNDKSYFIEVKVSADGYEWKKRFVLLNTGRLTSNFFLRKIS